MNQVGLLDELAKQVLASSPKQRAAAAQTAQRLLKSRGYDLWQPNPGPQTLAFFNEADELFYGGEAGGGKTDLLVGLSLTAHKKSLVLRRTNVEADKLFERYMEVLGSRAGWNGQENVWRLPGGRIVDIGGCQYEDDKQKRKGIPHDLIGFDEVADFTQTQYEFIIAWNRTIDPKQRCRIVAAGNPPTRPEGLWVIKRWAPWLDPKHPKPAKPGELRWFTTIQGKDTEVDGPGPHVVAGEAKPILARSRTFLRAQLTDNPDLTRTPDYAARLAALPKELRDAYRDGKFDAGLKDAPYQAIPTDWIRQAQLRWTERPPFGVPMCAIGVDVAAGGEDETVLAMRYDGWYAPLVHVPGSQTPLGRDVSGLVVAHRRDAAAVIVDLGGGYGGAVYEHLRENDIEVRGYRGAEKSTRRSRDARMKFSNVRTEAYWKFREALDPGQPGGSPIMLPDDPALVADLAAPTYRDTPHGIQLESKEDVVKRLARSTDSGDAVVMAWFSGASYMTHGEAWRRGEGTRGSGRRPKVIYGRVKPRGVP